MFIIHRYCNLSKRYHCCPQKATCNTNSISSTSRDIWRPVMMELAAKRGPYFLFHQGLPCPEMLAPPVGAKRRSLYRGPMECFLLLLHRGEGYSTGTSIPLLFFTWQRPAILDIGHWIFLFKLRPKDLKQIAKYPNSRILTRSRQSGEVLGIPTEPLPLALLRLDST